MAQLKPHSAVMEASRKALAMMNERLDSRHRQQSLYGLEHPAECSECGDTGQVFDVSGAGPWDCYACQRKAASCAVGCGQRCDGRMGCASHGGLA